MSPRRDRPYNPTRVPTQIVHSRPDNLAVVPGSLINRRDQWQAMANRLPSNGVLIVLPKSQPAQIRALLASASLLASQGHQIRVVSADEVERTKPPGSSI